VASNPLIHNVVKERLRSFAILIDAGANAGRARNHMPLALRQSLQFIHYFLHQSWRPAGVRRHALIGAVNARLTGAGGRAPA